MENLITEQIELAEREQDFGFRKLYNFCDKWVKILEEGRSRPLKSILELELENSELKKYTALQNENISLKNQLIEIYKFENEVLKNKIAGTNPAIK